MFIVDLFEIVAVTGTIAGSEGHLVMLALVLLFNLISRLTKVNMQFSPVFKVMCNSLFCSRGINLLKVKLGWYV